MYRLIFRAVIGPVGYEAMELVDRDGMWKLDYNFVRGYIGAAVGKSLIVRSGESRGW